MSKSTDPGSNLVYFLLGAAAGAAIALLFAPVEGEKARKMIGDKAGDVKDKATDFTSSVAQSARDRYSEIANKAQEVLGRSQQTMNDTMDNMREVAADAANGSGPA
jgi:gas vesicle protein